MNWWETEQCLSLEEAASVTADWLEVIQHLYHAITQEFPSETVDTCEAGQCGDYRKYRDLLRKFINSDLRTIRNY